MSKQPNKRKVEYALRGILKIVTALSTGERVSIKGVLDEFMRKCALVGTTNKELYLFGSAIQVLGQNMMAFAQGAGLQSGTFRNQIELDYARELLEDSQLLTVSKKQKFVAPEECQAAPDTEEKTPTALHPTKSKVNKMSKKQIKLYCEEHFDTDVDTRKTLPMLRKTLMDLIEV